MGIQYHVNGEKQVHTCIYTRGTVQKHENSCAHVQRMPSMPAGSQLQPAHIANTVQ